MNALRDCRIAALLVLLAGGALVFAGCRPSDGTPPTEAAPSTLSENHALNIRADQIKWDRIFPELGDRSAEISVLHVDSRTQATKLMIRIPADFHVPEHWHTGNETHTVLSGTFIVECEGKREVLGPGGFNYIPSKMRHEAWTSPDEGALLFITVDAGWDVNWVNGTPTEKNLLGGLRP